MIAPHVAMTRKTLSLALGIVLSLAVPLLAAAPPPNVIVIMVDDLGYYDLGCYGHPEIKTPVLDGLARDGIRLTSYYAGATVCTPSRMALLTGAYPTRVGWTRGVIGYLMDKKTQGLSPAAVTMAEVFKTRGYTTAISGKWHLGDRSEFLPQRQGFDVSYYINKSNNQTRELWRDDELVENPYSNRLLTEKFTTEAIRFIKEQGDKPFFLYIPYSAPHFPVQAHPDWKDTSSFGAYGDVVEEVDTRIGEIVETLKSAKIDKRTLIVFMSDNGPEKKQQAQSIPYRGLKWSSLEGGTRVPCIFYWPGVIPGGRESDELITAIDMLPTLCRACDIDLKTVSTGSPVVDGVDVWDTLLGTKGKTHPREDLLYWHGAQGFKAIRVGDWKLFLDGKATELPGRGKAPALFNVTDDPGEQTDLSAKYPEKLSSMRALAEKRLAAIAAASIPLGNQE